MKKIGTRRRKQLIGLLFVMPWILGFIAFTSYPLFMTIRYSLGTVRFLLDGVQITHIGWINFTEVVTKDPDFKLSLPQYLMQLLHIVPMVVVFSLLLAMLLNFKIKMRRFFRALFFMPVIIMSGPVVSNLDQMGAATIRGLPFFPIYRFISEYFPDFAANSILYIFDNAVLILWFSGVQILIFLSSLQKIDRSIYEAPTVDGASGWQQFWKLTMPILKPFIFLNLIYTIVDVSMSVKNPIIIFIKEGLFVATKGFGFSAAASWVYFAIILLAVILSYVLFGREEKTETGKRHDVRRRNLYDR